jgi:thiamine pyrophosphate-dependent acetolactate synthase large subunit-like protein
MRRGELAEAIAGTATDHVVITSLGSAARAWREHGGSNPTYYASDPMGAAPGLALGAAVARPDLQFLLLEGDGDLTMNLGILLTIAGAAPGNLRVALFANGRYETGGGQPLAAAHCADLAAIARGAGWRWVETVSGSAGGAPLVASVAQWLAAAAPALLVAQVESEAAPYGGPGELSGAEERARFRRELAAWELGRRHEGGT